MDSDVLVGISLTSFDIGLKVDLIDGPIILTKTVFSVVQGIMYVHSTMLGGEVVRTVSRAACIPLLVMDIYVKYFRPVFSTGFLLNTILVINCFIEICTITCFQLHSYLALNSAQRRHYKHLEFFSFQIYLSILSPIEKSLKSCLVKCGLKSR